MKMAATWFRARRGLAVGTVVGALTVGKAGPYLVHAFPGAGVAPVVLVASASATVAALLIVLGYRDGPYPFTPRPFSWGLVASVLRNREWRLASGGYFGHMAELYSFWTWIPAFVAASLTAATGSAVASSSPQASVLAFGVIAVGGAGCIWGGLASDRIGRERLVTWAMAASGACALLIGFTFGRSLWLLVPVALAWGFFVIADSAQFSVLVTESVPAHAVGTALTIQTSLGFLLTTFYDSGGPAGGAGNGLESRVSDAGDRADARDLEHTRARPCSASGDGATPRASTRRMNANQPAHMRASAEVSRA